MKTFCSTPRRAARLLISCWLLWGSSQALASEALTLSISRDGNNVPAAQSLRQLDVRSGDIVSLGSDFGESYAFRIEGQRRSSLGNKILSGRTESGARLALVITSDGVVQGSVRDRETHYRVVQQGDQLRWYRSDYYTAKPADYGALRKSRRAGWDDAKDASFAPQAMRRSAQRSLSEATVIYPVFGTGEATIKLLFYYDSEMTDAELVADLVTELGNQAMMDSGINIKLAIADGGIKPVELDATRLQEELLDDMFERNAPFSDIEEDRSFYDADLVILLREEIPPEDDACGIAYVGVVDGLPWRRLYMASVQWLPIENAIDGYYCADTTTAHEIGHMLGSQHERRLFEEGDVGAYEYSFGHYRDGLFKTIMSYGDEPEIAVFSNPALRTCSETPCGIAAGEPDAADNARGFTQTRFMLSGYEGAELAYELVQDFPVVEECELEDGSQGLRKGHGMANDSPFTLDIRAISALTADGEVISKEYTAGELSLSSGYFVQPRCEPSDSESPFGGEYRESWVTYAHPTQSEWVESLHLRWDNDYEGGYARVNVAGAEGGAVEGHTARLIRVGESLTATFIPEVGYQLAGVESSCAGVLEGNTYRLDNVTDDCLIEPRFEAALTPGDTFKLFLEEPMGASVYSGVGNLRGWAVATVGVEKIEVWIDGEYKFDVPYGGSRADVGDAYPEVPGSDDSGFSMAFNYNLLDAGAHSLTAYAFNQSSQSISRTVEFSVAKFHKSFLAAGDQVDLTGAQCSVDSDQIAIDDAIMDGRIYNILLEWRTAAQDFQITEIR